MPKITFMGAGSTVFAKNVIGDCLLCDSVKNDLDIALYDINEERLRESQILIEALNKTYNDGKAEVKPYLGEKNRREALRGTDFVINAIQVGGYEPCTVIDFEIPKKYGLRQTIGDTLGIGGIFRALRTIPVLRDFAEDIEAVCPNAWFLNYTNPMAMLTGYMQRYTKVKTIGLCHSVQICSEKLLERLGIENDGVVDKIAGINPTYVGELPSQLAAMNMTNINVQLLTIEAAVTRKRESIYHAAMLDPHTAKLQKKLGFNFVLGGHPFEEMLNPDKVMPSGKSLWEEHSEWFGLPENGVKTKEKAQSVGFCVSNDELLAYIAERILDKAQNEWYEADSIAIWGFDTWGGICTCDKCKKLGNGADHTLRLASYLKAYLDNAYEQGKLDRRVKINFSAYEGTSDLFPPINEIPENLKNSSDIASFCPINRCYAHCIDDASCEFNRKYSEALRGWQDVSIRLNEYYNVSKFEDLPFLFTKSMVNDFKFYHRCGVKGMVYMHVPMLHLDLNYAKYGRDCMELTTLFVMYHEALRTDGNHHALFKQIDELSQKMMGYYIPLRWFGHQIDIKCQDALSRCQLKSLYYRCRAYRECNL